jgi:hypothetical protein
MSRSGATSPEELAVARRRLSLLVAVAATAGDFSPKLADAVGQATDEEVTIMADLVAGGMSIPALVSFLQGAHVIVGDEGLYRAWIFPTSRRRLSSHHRTVDKSTSPDYGLDGPLVREALYGLATAATWIQLERTKATFRWGRLPTWSDVLHMRDYVIYRVTGMNVGPWGLSAHVDTRPMVLRPPNSTAGHGAGPALAAFTRQRAAVDGVAQEQAWASVLTPAVPPVGPAGDLFAAPVPEDALDLLPDTPFRDDLGLGLFGGLPLVRATAELHEGVMAILDAPAPPLALTPPGGDGQAVEIPVGGRALQVGATRVPAPGRDVTFLGLEEAPA